MTPLQSRLAAAIADKGLSIGDAWALLELALERIDALEAEVKLLEHARIALVQLPPDTRTRRAEAVLAGWQRPDGWGDWP